MRTSRPISICLMGWLALAAVGSEGVMAGEAVRGAAVNAASDLPIDFENDIMPVLTHAGCNAGGCHGKQSGQNGFKLSLFGFDAASDYQEIVQRARGRRINFASPEHSLLIQKSVAAVPHGGGRKILPGTGPYDLLVRWVGQGAPRSAPDAPRVVSIRFAPGEHVFAGTSASAQSATQSVQLAVLAKYSDGREVDVTRSAQLRSNFDLVARVDAQGLVETGSQRGEAAIMARYQNKVAVFRAIVPHGPSLAEIPDFPTDHFVDRLAAGKWKKLGLKPSPLADDATFLRRVTLDLCGRLPTVEETREFLAASAADSTSTGHGGVQRAALIDRLLASPDYATFFAMRWGTILRNSNQAGSEQAAYAFHNWLKDMVARNRPYDEFVRGIVAASGEWQDAPAINWYWQMRDDPIHRVVGDTAQVFLGLRLNCAQCHHHPYERWSQDDYYGLAGFFARVGRKSFGEPPPYFASPRVTNGVVHPRTGQVALPVYLDGKTAEFTPYEDPRHGLVDWMVQPENPFFARAMVNRLWGHFLGRGIVDPVDDMRETNPPSNPELLDALAREFVEHKYDVKHVIRAIVTSRVYALSSEPTDANRADQQNFARFYPRRIIAEVLLDALDQTCGTRTRFGGISNAGRSIDLPHEGFGSYFLDAFDRPKRLSGCECERSPAATLSQVLLLANSDEVENKVGAGDGRLARLAAENKENRPVIEELFLAAFARRPTDHEYEKSQRVIDSVPSDKRREAWEDILWTLINTKEFGFNH